MNRQKDEETTYRSPAPRITAHPHGPHECYCPSCGTTTIVPADVKCRELTCTACGDRMRASETGERR